MKRHPALVPLSREHHTGLVIAQRLILGRSTNPRSPWPSDVHSQAGRLLQFFEKELQPHFKFEEVELFPRLLEWSTAGAVPWQPLLHDLRHVALAKFLPSVFDRRTFWLLGRHH